MSRKIVYTLIGFLVVLLFISNNPNALAVSSVTYQFAETIDMNGYGVDDIDSDGSNLIALYGGWPNDNIGIFDLSGNLLDSFNAPGAFSAGVTFNGSDIVFSGGQSYDGQINEMNPSDGSISGPLGYSGWTQPYLAFDGSNVLASGPASGSNGVLIIPIYKLDSTTYNNVGSISVTVDTGTTASGVSRSVIAWHDDNLFAALSIGGTNKVYQFDSNLDLIQEITISQIVSGQAIKALTFVGDDLFVANYSVNEIYRYTPVPESTITATSPNGGEELFAGEIFDITWTSEGEIRNVQIEYSVNDGVGWTEIVASTENDGSFYWDVPCDLSDDSLIKISDVDSDASDTSDAVFFIVDIDSDGVCGDIDNCPEDYNPEQLDYDEDGIGDVCDVDADGDGFTFDNDCDDLDYNINPGACDIKKDGIDQDCDGFDRTRGRPCASGGDNGEPSSKEGPAKTCDDGIDNDDDGYTDCDDSDCAKKKNCRI